MSNRLSADGESDSPLQHMARLADDAGLDQGANQIVVLRQRATLFHQAGIKVAGRDFARLADRLRNGHDDFDGKFLFLRGNHCGVPVRVKKNPGTSPGRML